jgi:hypothetical protein
MSVKKLTVTDLLKEKEKYQVKSNVTDELFIERFDASITIRKLERSLCVESFQMAQDPNQSEKADPFIVYNAVTEPNLKDTKLHKEFGCVEPTDIVEKIFEPGEIFSIARAALEMAGYKKSVERVADLKN